MKSTGRSGPKARIIVVGGIYIDIVTVTDELPGAGEYAYASKLQFVVGGNGLNQAVAAARLGGDSQLVGFIGKDSFGSDVTNFLKSENVDTIYLRTSKSHHTGTIVYLIADNVERHIVFTGSNMKASVNDLPEIDISSSDIVAASLTVPHGVIYSAFKKAKKASAKTILNLFPNYDVSKRLLELCDYIILNEVELAFRSGRKDLIRAHHKDMKMDPKTILALAKKIKARPDQVIITTLAQRGLIGIRDDNITIVNGIKVKFVDAIGAGDCLLGAFATGITEGMGFGEALRFANCAAAISVQKIGATTSFPKRKEVDALLKKQE